MTRKKTFELQKTQNIIPEVTPHDIWPNEKFLLKRDGPRASYAIIGSSCPKFHPSERANAIDDCLENQVIPHYLWDDNNERLEEARFHAQLETVDDIPTHKITSCDVQKINKISEIK